MGELIIALFEFFCIIFLIFVINSLENKNFELNKKYNELKNKPKRKK